MISGGPEAATEPPRQPARNRSGNANPFELFAMPLKKIPKREYVIRTNPRKIYMGYASFVLSIYVPMGIREWPRSAEGNLLPLPGAAQLNDKNSESTIPQIVMKGTAVLKSRTRLSKEGKKDGAETGKPLDKTARKAIAQMAL